ncbi:Protein of unknown function, partial [Gryllus bimaculatus]
GGGRGAGGGGRRRGAAGGGGRQGRRVGAGARVARAGVRLRDALLRPLQHHHRHQGGQLLRQPGAVRGGGVGRRVVLRVGPPHHQHPARAARRRVHRELPAAAPVGLPAGHQRHRPRRAPLEPAPRGRVEERARGDGPGRRGVGQPAPHERRPLRGDAHEHGLPHHASAGRGRRRRRWRRRRRGARHARHQLPPQLAPRPPPPRPPPPHVPTFLRCSLLKFTAVLS